MRQASRELVYRAIRDRLLPFAKQQYPHLCERLQKMPYPRAGNLFVVQYDADSKKPGGRMLKLHEDFTALTFNIMLSPDGGFSGGERGARG